MANKVLILPDGQRVQAANVTSYYLNSGTLNVNMVDGSTKTFDATSNPLFAQAILDSFDAAMHAAADEPIQVTSGSPYTLKSFFPNPFVFATDTVTINGTGFTPDMNAFIQIDSEWPLDLDSQRMKITYVSPTQITAVFDTDGNGFVGSSYFIVLVDSLGRVSNSLPLASID